MEAALVALGGELLVAGVLARLGRRILLPTIPLFVLAGHERGPDTSGIALVDSADRLILSTHADRIGRWIGHRPIFAELTTGGIA